MRHGLPCPPRLAVAPHCSRAASATWSAVKPNCCSSVLDAGADAPKLRMAMISPSRPGVAVPAERRRRLDRDARRDRRRQHAVAIGRRPAPRTAPSDGIETTRALTPSPRQLLARLHAQRDLAAACAIRITSGCRPRRRRARRRRARGPRPARSWSRSSVGSAWRDRTRRSGRSRAAQRDAPGLGGLVGVAGADHASGRGIARSAASCSIGWWVGPSCAEADGVVGEDVDHRQLHQRGQADRRPHVVAEDQEGAERRGAGRRAPCRWRSPPMACSRTPKCRLRPP